MEDQARGLVEALADTRRDGVIGRVLGEKTEQLEEQYVALIREREDLRRKIAVEAFGDDDATRALEMRSHILVGIENATPDDRRRVLEFLRVRVVVNGDKAQVSCILPIQDGVIALRAPLISTAAP